MMAYVDRDGSGNITGVFATAQSVGQEFVDGAVLYVDPAVVAKDAQNVADAAAAKADSKLNAIANMTPAQVRAWIAANVSNLADAKDALATLAVAVSVLARRL